MMEWKLRSGGESRGERQSVIDDMMAKTTILNSNDDKVRFVRDLYDAMNSQGGDMATSILSCLSGEDSAGLSVRFDCDSDHLGNLQRSFASLTGALLDGRRLQNHADCRDGGGCVVSMAAPLETSDFPREKIVGRLARTLARAALHKVFGNGGLPYGRTDAERQMEFRGIVDKVIARYSPATGEFIKWVVENDSPAVRELGLACAVPEIVAVNGTENGKKMLQELYPDLLQFYESHVLTKILK